MSYRFRAWVMVSRERVDSPQKSAYEHLADLLTMDSSRIRKILSTFGDHDFVVPVEAESLEGIHDAVVQMDRGEGVDYTTTYVAVRPDFSNAGRFDGGTNNPQAVVRIITDSDARSAAYEQLRTMPEIDLVDIVFGDCDLIALVRPNGTNLEFVSRKLKTVRGIRKTITMLPYLPAYLQNQTQ